MVPKHNSPHGRWQNIRHANVFRSILLCFRTCRCDFEQCTFCQLQPHICVSQQLHNRVAIVWFATNIWLYHIFMLTICSRIPRVSQIIQRNIVRVPAEWKSTKRLKIHKYINVHITRIVPFWRVLFRTSKVYNHTAGKSKSTFYVNVSYIPLYSLGHNEAPRNDIIICRNRGGGD